MQFTDVGGVTKAVLAGRLDSYSVNDIEARFVASIVPKEQNAIVDLSEVSFIASLGIRMLLRHRHPRYGGMRIGLGGLTIWSFLVATAHGAGLMVLPVWLAMKSSADQGAHAGHMPAASDLASGLTATAIHGAGYLLVTALVAWIVFAKLGVELLRTKWINLDAIWAAALILSGGLVVALPGL